MQAAAATGTDPSPATTEQAPARHWSLVDSSGICPTARSGHSAVVAKNSLYIFGGCGHPAVKRPDEAEAISASSSSDDLAEAMPVCLGDLNVYDLARQRWSEVLPTSTACPAERTCAAMCASEEEDRLFLSGGAGDDPYDLRADLLEFDVRRRSWRVLYDGGAQVDDVDSAGSEGGGGVVAAGASACRRIGHAMVHDAGRNRLVVFGGSTGHEYFDDTHAFDLAAGTWAPLATTGDRPSPRYKHQVFVDANVMYVIGGGSYEPEGPDLDAYRLHFGGPKALEWERVRPTGVPPRCRAAHGLAWDRVGRQAYIWGGFTSDMELDSTFCALRLPPPAPAAAVTAAAAAAVVSDGASDDAARQVSSMVVEGASIPGSTDHHPATQCGRNAVNIPATATDAAAVVGDGASDDAARQVSSMVVEGASIPGSTDHHPATQCGRNEVNIPATATASVSSTSATAAARAAARAAAIAAATASTAAATAAAMGIGEFRGLARFVEADTSVGNGTRRVSAARVARNKPPGGEVGSSANDTELAQQQQHYQQNWDPQLRDQQQWQQRDQQQQQPPVSRAEDSRSSRGRRGQERWRRRRGHRLLRQEESGELNNGGNGGSGGNDGGNGVGNGGNSGNSGGSGVNSSGNNGSSSNGNSSGGNGGNGGGRVSSGRRSRGGRRRRTWGQGWTTGRLQGFWGGGGGLGRADNPPSPSGPPLPPPLPATVPTVPALAPSALRQAPATVVVASATDTRRARSDPISSSANRSRRSSATPPSYNNPPPEPEPEHQEQRLTPTAKIAPAGELLSWVSLPNQGQSSRGGGGGGGSPAGRSFHCAFFHGGACYVTGGSDGARKFGDMWRFCARDSPPPLTTLAARVIASQAVAMKGGGGGSDDGGGGGGSDGDGGGDGGGGSGRPKVDVELLEGLPEELREALANLNMQAEVVL